MTTDLEAALMRDFPRLYVGIDLPPTASLLCFGFECHDGWEPLIRRLSAQLEPLGIRATQVKEKFGALRFYFEPYRDDAQELIDRAALVSMSICELCGGPGRLRTDRAWLRTLCAEHAKEAA